MRRKQDFSDRLSNKWRRFATTHFGRRDFALESRVPYVSFTFDDFPRSAFIEGGRILTAVGSRGTYFASSQLLGGPSPSGLIAQANDLAALVQEGHELGCHTFDHLDGVSSTDELFERSISANAAALGAIVPSGISPVFAYPLNGPVLKIKRAVGRQFVACRGGGQDFNTGVIDLNLLRAFFLDWRNRGSLDAVRDVIEKNGAARGWLIFATHDVNADPSRYGCEPDYFENVVSLAIESGARVVPMMQACRELGIAR